MRSIPLRLRLAVVAVALLAAKCGVREQVEKKRLEEENVELRARIERLERENRLLRGQPSTASDVTARFADDPTQGTLAGLLPGDELPHVHFRFGRENRIRTWSSEGRILFQHEWDLEGGLVLRVNAEGNGRVEKIAAVLGGSAPVDIPTLAGIRLGKETFSTLQQKFGSTLTTELQLWGAQGLYTVARRTPLPGAKRRLEFVFQMPEGLNRSELERIGAEVERRSDASVVEPYLRDRTPFLVALEEVR
jgi:hypothetical protein